MTTDAEQFWDEQAARFDEEPDHGLRDPEVFACWRELLLATLPPPPARVADLGCGTGSITALLAAEGYDVHGVDLAGAMVAAAGAKLAAAGLRRSSSRAMRRSPRGSRPRSTWCSPGTSCGRCPTPPPC